MWNLFQMQQNFYVKLKIYENFVILIEKHEIQKKSQNCEVLKKIQKFISDLIISFSNLLKFIYKLGNFKKLTRNFYKKNYFSFAIVLNFRKIL